MIVRDRRRAYISPVFYLTLMFSLLGSDFFLWWRADRQLRAIRYAAVWRTAAALFALLQIFFMMRILLWPYLPRHDSNIVIVLGFCFAYAWHLLVIPVTLLAMLIGAAQ